VGAYTAQPLAGRAKLTVPTNALTIVANIPLSGPRQYSIPIQVADGYLFDRQWDRYYFAVVGLIRHIDLEGDRYTAPSQGPDHSLRLFSALRLIGERPQLDIAPWWQVAYIPKRGGGEPPLVPQLRWWPGCGGGMALSFRDNLERHRAPATTDWTAAMEARRLLLMVDHQMKQTGRPSKDARDIRTTLDPIVRSLRAKRLDPTEDRVAAHLPRQRGRPRDPRVIRRWINDTLKMSWSDYIESVN